MSVEEHKAHVRRYYEDALYNPGACDEIYAPTFRFHTIQHASITPQVTQSTPQSEKAAYEWLKAVWSSDWRMTIDEMIAEGDRVLVRWTFNGMHLGELSGLPPTHKQVTYSGINIFRVADGKIAEIWDIYDRLWMWQQLGVLPDIKVAIAKARGSMLSHQCGETEKHCYTALLETCTFQAPGFHQRLGYEVFAVIDGYPGGVQKPYLKKRLAPESRWPSGGSVPPCSLSSLAAIDDKRRSIVPTKHRGDRHGGNRS